MLFVIPEKIIIFAYALFLTCSHGKGLKGNQVKILNSPAAVSFIKVFEQYSNPLEELSIVHCFREGCLKNGVSQKTCKVYCFDGFEERLSENKYYPYFIFLDCFSNKWLNEFIN